MKYYLTIHYIFFQYYYPKYKNNKDTIYTATPNISNNKSTTVDKFIFFLKKYLLKKKYLYGNNFVIGYLLKYDMNSHFRPLYLLKKKMLSDV